MKKTPLITGIILGLIMGLTAAPVMAATFTLTIPAAWVSVTVDCFSLGYGYTDVLTNGTDAGPPDGLDDSSGLNQTAFAKRTIRNWVHSQVRNYKSNLDGNAAAGAAATTVDDDFDPDVT